MFRSYLTPLPPRYFGSAPKSRIVPEYPRRKGGMPNKSEQTIIDHIAKQPEHQVTPAILESAAIIVHKSPETLARHVIAARQRLTEHAEKYVDLHMQSADAALANGEYGEARKAAEWALEKISVGSRRIVDAPSTAQSTAPVIRIGIALGGISNNSRPADVIDADVEPTDE